MNLCVVVPSFTGGGAERIAVNLANQYALSGHSVVVVVFNGFGPYREQVSDSVKILDLKSSRVRYVLPRLLKAFREIAPTTVLSVVRLSNVMTGIAGYFYPAARMVFREANTMDGVLKLPPLKKWLMLRIMQIAYRRADKIVANSEGTRRSLLTCGVAHQDKVVVIGNPVLPANLEQLSSAVASHRWLEDKSVKVVLSVGRLHPQKRQDVLIRAFAIVSRGLTDIRLLILGEGSERERLLSLVEELNVSEVVDIVPFSQNPYPYYKNAAVFVLASEWEGFGNVLVEAMACELPVICTDCPGGPREILRGGRFGVLVPVGDVSALSVELSKILTKETKVDLKSAKERAMEYGVSAISKSYERELL